MPHVLRKGWRKQIFKLERGVSEAELETINDTALMAADLDRAKIRKIFINRNKWTVNSVWPKHGSRAGLIPLHKVGARNVYVRVGSVQDYMRKQEDGWTAQNPQVPTNQARVGGVFRKRIKKAASLQHIRSKGVLTASSFRRPRTRRSKIRAMIGAVNKGKFRGVIQIHHTDPTSLPAGYYKVMRRRSLVMWRLSQQGPKRRKSTKWHSKTMADPRIPRQQTIYYIRNATKRLKKQGLR